MPYIDPSTYKKLTWHARGAACMQQQLWGGALLLLLLLGECAAAAVNATLK
jgi:hypothetical protein